jgi:hypothetical protein
MVTDHGWRLMPGGFTSVKLPPSATATNWSRSVVLSTGAAPELACQPWHWDASVRIAMAPGAEAFRAGDVYSHGGLSLQRHAEHRARRLGGEPWPGCRQDHRAVQTPTAAGP